MLFNLLVAIININTLLSCNNGDCQETSWQVRGNSRLEISGTTNINEFHCLSVSYGGEDIMKEDYSQASESSSLSGEIVMKSSGFDCHNSMMTRDFSKAVKASEFPEISIRFIGLKENPSRKNVLFGKVEITLAGEARIYTVSCIVKEESEKSKHLKGTRTFYFSDFGLQPPQKLFGAVKVKDAVSVDFHLKLQKLL
ncbi:hypothetical protein OKW21_004436 [Catalinimonas alkaloidigena]|uniref:YceI family protein n=1 Tax=Catalinimonas alkaloidigena TaxID=1075417 RepID=UPI002405E445|nr:YceI family protein [Catalinimonas alkaloidigena]MDF9799173.1 hypothetical protein [Catalinimonas alkaloidigena]